MYCGCNTSNSQQEAFQLCRQLHGLPSRIVAVAVAAHLLTFPVCCLRLQQLPARGFGSQLGLRFLTAGRVPEQSLPNKHDDIIQAAL